MPTHFCVLCLYPSDKDCMLKSTACMTTDLTSDMFLLISMSLSCSTDKCFFFVI